MLKPVTYAASPRARSSIRRPQITQPAVIAKPVTVVSPLSRKRTDRPKPELSELALPAMEPGPSEDYGRSLTPQGGIQIFYKDFDLRFRQYFTRALVWSAFTGGEGWFLLHDSPVRSGWINSLCFLTVVAINWLIIHKPSECLRQLEVRPDCLIIEETDVFWRRYMQAGPPALEADEAGNQRFCGIYGTRFVEFLTIRRFDELDRTPDVIAVHLTNAFEQLWAD